MIRTRPVVAILLTLTTTSVLSACGGGQGNQNMAANQQQGGAPHTMTDVAGGWKQIAISGTNTTFEMPSPVAAEQLQDGMLKYTAKEGKRSFVVGATSRDMQKDKQAGVTNDAALKQWADQILQANMMVFEQMKLKPQINFVGNFKVGNSAAVQYSGKVGKADVTYICYVTDNALYYLEAITQNPQSPEVQRFISAFKP